MGVHEESPNTSPARNLCMGAATLAPGGLVWAIDRLFKNPDGTHVGLFLVFALLLAVEFYLLWLIWVLASVAYRVDSSLLLIAQGWQRLVVPRAQVLHLYRWRQRWIWDGAAQIELGVTEIALFPPLWIREKAAIWVVVYEGDDGERKAVAIQASPQLAGFLKEWTLQRSAEA